MTAQETLQGNIKDHFGRPIARDTFYARDSDCFPQARNAEERRIVKSRTTSSKLYKITYIDDLTLQAVFLGREEPERVSFEGQEAVKFASSIRPVSDVVVKGIADRYYAKARLVELALFDALRARVGRDQRSS